LLHGFYCLGNSGVVAPVFDSLPRHLKYQEEYVYFPFFILKNKTHVKSNIKCENDNIKHIEWNIKHVKMNYKTC
jgi:hypothetical protein